MKLSLLEGVQASRAQPRGKRGPGPCKPTKPAQRQADSGGLGTARAQAGLAGRAHDAHVSGLLAARETVAAETCARHATRVRIAARANCDCKNWKNGPRYCTPARKGRACEASNAGTRAVGFVPSRFAQGRTPGGQIEALPTAGSTKRACDKQVDRVGRVTCGCWRGQMIAALARDSAISVAIEGAALQPARRPRQNTDRDRQWGLRSFHGGNLWSRSK
jgi:hypothetical protein